MWRFESFAKIWVLNPNCNYFHCWSIQRSYSYSLCFKEYCHAWYIMIMMILRYFYIFLFVLGFALLHLSSLFSFLIMLSWVCVFAQFLAQLKLMDYSLLVGLHDIERGEQEQPEEEIEENEGGEEEGAESDGGVTGSPPESPSNTLDSSKPLGPGEFDPTVDVYAIRSHESECVNTVKCRSIRYMHVDHLILLLRFSAPWEKCIYASSQTPPKKRCTSWR